jgi:hypothetical protein
MKKIQIMNKIINPPFYVLYADK